MPGCCVPGCHNNYTKAGTNEPLYPDTQLVSSFSFPDPEREDQRENFFRWKTVIKRDWSAPDET